MATDEPRYKVRVHFTDDRGQERTLEAIGTFETRQRAEDYKHSLERIDRLEGAKVRRCD